MKLGMATQNAARVVGMHFFNPFRSFPGRTGDDADDQPRGVRARRGLRARRPGQAVVRSADRSGFVVNALLVPYLLSAIRMVGVPGSRRSRTSTRPWSWAVHPMGPLKLTDLVGLDTVKAIADKMYEEFKGAAVLAAAAAAAHGRGRAHR